MKKLKKKQRKAIQKEIVNEVTARYECLCGVDELTSNELLDSIFDLLESRNEPYEIALATLKNVVCRIHFADVLEERGIEVEEN